MKTPVYHVGLFADQTTAVFQYRRSVDFLSCEILKYYGRRETTKAAAKSRLQSAKQVTLAELNRLYPDKGFTRVTID